MPAAACTTPQSHGGQAALPAALLALALLVSLGLVARWGHAALSSSRAQAAADTAALMTLAGADLAAIAQGVFPDDAVASTAVLEAGGVLVAFDVHVDDGVAHVEVVVEIEGQRASAAAASPLPDPDRAAEIPGG